MTAMSKVISIAHVRAAGRKNCTPLHELCENTISERTVLNKMCSSLLSPGNRKSFRAFPESYCREYGLSLEQINAVTDLDITKLLQLGCSVTCIDRLTSIYVLDSLTLCMEQTGKSLDETRALLTND